MLNGPRVYRHPIFQIILAISIFGILAAIILLSSDTDSAFVFLPLGIIILLLAVFSIYSLTGKVTISDSEISVQNIFGTKSLRWTEISRVSGSHNGIKLHNFDGDVTVSPSPQLPGYEEIVEWIGTQRPDLFNPQDNEEMSRSWVMILLFVLFVILIVGIAGFSVVQTQQWFLSIFFVFVGAMILFIVASSPLSITLEGRSLLLKYVLGQKTLLADEIESIQLVSQRTRNGKTYHIRLNLPGGKGLRISGLRPSLPIVYLTLKNWHNRMKSSRN